MQYSTVPYNSVLEERGPDKSGHFYVCVCVYVCMCVWEEECHTAVLGFLPDMRHGLGASTASAKEVDS